jgi:hypothetical protein
VTASIGAALEAAAVLVSALSGMITAGLFEARSTRARERRAVHGLQMNRQTPRRLSSRVRQWHRQAVLGFVAIVGLRMVSVRYGVRVPDPFWLQERKAGTEVAHEPRVTGRESPPSSSRS